MGPDQRIAMAWEILKGFDTEEEWKVSEKIGSIGLVLMALEISPTEKDWRCYLRMAGVNIFDPEVEIVCRGATCLYHYSNLLNIRDPEEDTWLNDKDYQSFIGVTDENFAKTVSELQWQAKVMREAFVGG